MKKILITGATGNVGRAVISQLSLIYGQIKILAGVRNPGKVDFNWPTSTVTVTPFDFADQNSIRQAIKKAGIIFLLRPPQITDVEKYFAPLIRIAQEYATEHIVFLSVQGVTTNSLIPHYKIEQLIKESGIPFTMLRPAYFMQNFTTVLRKDIVENSQIFLPAGRAKFTLIDLMDVGKVAARVLSQPEAHVNKAYALTNDEQLTFRQMATTLSSVLGRKINFKSPGLITFFWVKKKAGLPTGIILVMIMLHYLPRFRGAPITTDWVAKICGSNPRSFAEFVVAHKNMLNS